MFRFLLNLAEKNEKVGLLLFHVLVCIDSIIVENFDCVNFKLLILSHLTPPTSPEWEAKNPLWITA